MTAMSETLERPAEARDERTGDVALTAWQVAYEQRAFWRNRTRAFFSFGMPVMLLLLFGALNSGGRIQELGNIPYVTQTIPTYIFSALNGPDGLAKSTRLIFVSIGLAFAALLLSEWLERRGQERRP